MAGWRSRTAKKRKIQQKLIARKSSPKKLPTSDNLTRIPMLLAALYLCLLIGY